MNNMEIKIIKNRGWRGLASAECIDTTTHTTIREMIFSFSQDVWNDMLAGYFVMQDDDNYYIYTLDKEDVHLYLPRPTQQRSVLIGARVRVTDVIEIGKRDTALRDSIEQVKNLIAHFEHNSNEHTTSDWNCVGIRVVPMI